MANTLLNPYMYGLHGEVIAWYGHRLPESVKRFYEHHDLKTLERVYQWVQNGQRQESRFPEYTPLDEQVTAVLAAMKLGE